MNANKMMSILEIEDDVVIVSKVLMGAQGSCLKQAIRVPARQSGRDGGSKMLSGLDPAILGRGEPVHVIIGDRRSQHFCLDVPFLSGAELAGLIRREAVRALGVAASDDILVNAAIVGRVGRDRLTIAVTALLKSVWQPVAEVLADLGASVAGLYTTESCLAMASRDLPEKVAAVLEANGGRARFVLCRSGHAAQVRRFLLGSHLADDSLGMSSQLAMELPRTLEWLRESGHPLPEVILLGTRVSLGNDVTVSLPSELGAIRVADHGVDVAEDASQAAGLAGLMLVRRLAAGAPPTSLLDPLQLVAPWSRRRWAAVCSAGLLAVSGVVLAVGEVEAWDHLRSERQRLVLHGEELMQQAQDLRSEVEGLQPDDSVWLQLSEVLKQRKPFSRMFGELCNLTSPQISLEELKISAFERTLIVGLVEGSSRSEALASLAEFLDRVRSLPYLASGSEEEVLELPGLQPKFRFRVQLEWSKS